MANELANAPQDRDNDWKVPPRGTCKGCGGIEHGGVNAGRACLETALALVRAQNSALRAQLIVHEKDVAAFERFKQLRESVRTGIWPQDRVLPRHLRTNPTFNYGPQDRAAAPGESEPLE